MNPINLSYVMTTYNKLPYLKEVMKRLLKNVKEDEEIVVVDGASTDGTVEYLIELYKQGKINQFISEPDKGEAHGYNKGLLMAKGSLIKIITDDDAFYYPGIQECKNFMLEHPEIDVVGTNGAGNGQSTSPIKISYTQDYALWKNKKTPFAFCGLGLMIRRISIPLFGLCYTGVIRVDAEFSFRITSSPVNLAWYNEVCWVHIGNSSSNSVKFLELMDVELKKMEQFYLGITKPPKRKLLDTLILLFDKLLAKSLNLMKKSVFSLEVQHQNQKEIEQISFLFSDIIKHCEDWLERCNNKKSDEKFSMRML